MITNEDLAIYLFAENQLSFPGLGSVMISYKEAKLSPGKNKIFGPELISSFLYNQVDNFSYQRQINYHCRSRKITASEAENEIQKISVNVLNDLALSGFSQLKGLGVFYNNGGDISFQPETIYEESYKHGFPDIPLVLIKKDKPQLEIKEETIQTVVTKPEKKNYGVMFTALGVFGTVFCLLVCYSPFGKYKDHTVNTQNHQIASKNLDTKVTITNDSVHVTKNQETQNTISSIDSSNLKVETPLSNTGKSILVNNSGNNESNIKSKGISIIGSEKFLNITTILNNSDKLKHKYPNTCIIITGSFNKSGNINTMLKKLRRYKYQIFAEENGRFTRIGIVFDCNKNSLQDELAKVKSQVEPNSWILQPKQD